jgi:hypothetical protein
MTEKKQRAAALAAASVLGLSLGMVALNADAEQTKQQTQNPSNQIKDGATQLKHSSGFLKTPTNQGKFIAGDHKIGTSNQIKWQGVSNQGKFKPGEKIGINPQPEPPGGAVLSSQHKNQVPSSELNPQPEPPKPTGAGTPK